MPHSTEGDYSGMCPHCGRGVGFGELRDAFTPFPSRDFYQEEGAKEHEFWYLVKQCRIDDCLGVVFLKVRRSDKAVVESYPYRNALPDILSKSIQSAGIREDMAEAVSCFHAKAYKAVAMMCRCVVQGIAQDMGIKSGRNPQEQIKKMRAKNLITERMFTSAMLISQFGGFSAHPRNDGLDDITKDQADRILVVTNRLLMMIYGLSDPNKAFNKEIQEKRQPKS